MLKKEYNYEYTDKIITYLRRKAVRKFKKAKADLLDMDEINVMRYSQNMYDELLEETKRRFLELARKIYKSQVDEDADTITDLWVLDFLNRYDPITMYVFLHEVERKESRFAESVVASDAKAKEIDKALRLWANMIAQYAVEITDEAAMEAYRENAAKLVVWLTEEDERVCPVCRKRNLRRYPINNVPTKPHFNCRCRIVPV